MSIVLQDITEEKDLGAYTTSDLTPSLQWWKATSKAMSVLGMTEDFRMLYNYYSGLHIKCTEVHAWLPYLWKDIEYLDNVHKRATKLLRCEGCKGILSRCTNYLQGRRESVLHSFFN